MELRQGEQSKAQRHVFFAERNAAKVADLAKEVTPRRVESAAVIGAGTMGGGIAMCFANAGIPVTLVEVNAAALAHGLDVIAGNYRASAARAGPPRRSRDAAGADQRRHRHRAVGTADIIIEAATEDMAIKKEVFGKLDRLAKADAVLATNTSYLDIDAIAAEPHAVRNPCSACISSVPRT